MCQPPLLEPTGSNPEAGYFAAINRSSIRSHELAPLDHVSRLLQASHEKSKGLAAARGGGQPLRQQRAPVLEFLHAPEVDQFAIYVRVSTDDQSTASQKAALQARAERAGHTVIKVYEDHGISGAKGPRPAPRLRRAAKAAVRRECDMIAVWSSDRLGRSLSHLVEVLQTIPRHRDRPLHPHPVCGHHDSCRAGPLRDPGRACGSRGSARAWRAPA